MITSLLTLCLSTFFSSPAADQQPPAAPAPAKQPMAKTNTATTPAPRTDGDWMKRHEGFNAIAKEGHEKGNIGMIFLGDSITDGWRGGGKDVWKEFYEKRHAVNFGIGGDRTQHVLWRIENGELDGLAKPEAGSAPKLVVLMIGTNNSNGKDNTSEEIAAGVKAIVDKTHEKLPEAKILVLAIFPRGEKPTDGPRMKNEKANEIIAKLADDKTVFYLDIGKKFLREDGTMDKKMMGDYLHPGAEGYKIWADAIEPTVKKLMGEESSK